MNNDDLKVYSWHPEAFEKLTPEKRIEFWNRMLARIDYFYEHAERLASALKAIRENNPDLTTGVQWAQKCNDADVALNLYFNHESKRETE